MKQTNMLRWDLGIIITILSMTFGVVVYQVRQDAVQTAQIAQMNQTLAEMKEVLKILTGVQMEIGRLTVRVSSLERSVYNTNNEEDK